MKTTLVFTFLCEFNLCAANLSAQKAVIKLPSNQLTIGSFFSSIESQSGYLVVYSNRELNTKETVSFSKKKAQVDELLQEFLRGRNMKYEFTNNYIVFSKASENRKIAQQQNKRRITGTVVSQSGESIIGASIKEAGTSNGTITDINGHFSLELTTGKSLVISSVGYQSQTVAISRANNYSVTLKEDMKILDEVVVVGYGVQRKSDITGSVSSVKASELNSAPNTSTLQALQGRVAGVMVQNTSGDPAGGASIRIRGANSLTYGNDPLVIVDGVQDASIGSLNPNQIESMEVLKDAAALSIYGSRGANGVIIVTTKKGKHENVQISYNGFMSFDKVRKILPSLGARQYATLLNDAQAANNLSALFTDSEISQMRDGTNWQNEIFRNAVSQTHNITIGAAKKGISYYIAAGISDKNGVVINSNYREYNVRSNLKAEATKHLTLSLNAFASYSMSHKGDTSGAITSALKWSPTKDVYTDEGKYVQPGGGVGPVSDYNPVGLAKEIVQDANTTHFNISLMGEYRFTDYLKFSSLLAYKSNATMNGWFDNQVYNIGPEEDIAGSKTNSMYWSLQNTNILTFDKDFKGHHIQATAVYEWLKDKYNSTQASSKGIPMGMGYQGVHFGTVLQKPWLEYTSTSMSSFMGRINYAYKNKYLMSVSVRRDGASQLAEGHKYENFAAISLGWNVMEEKFMEGIKNVIPEFKIRGSFGSVGNAAVPAFSSQMKFTPGTDANGNATLSIAQLSNNNLKWERTKEFNIGIDTRLWDGRFSLSAEYYSKKTTDLLMWQKVPSALGVQSILTNVGAVRNRGWEIALGGTPISNKDITWSINYSVNYNKNKIVALDGLSDTLVSTAFDMPGLVGSFVEMVDQPMGTFLGYKFAGVWKNEEVSTAALYGAKPGDAKYVDLNSDGKIDSKDIGIIGNAQPKYTFGLNNTIRWKNFDLNIFFQGVYGNDVYNQNRVRRESYSGGGAFPTSPDIANHWTSTNQTNIPSFTGSEYANSSRWVEDGSYLRLKNLTIGYNIPSSFLQKLKFTQFRIYVSATNLWTITHYRGYDPEASMGIDASGAGIDRGIYPSTKSWVIGLDITF